jgi:hypothetical protein
MNNFKDLIKINSNISQDSYSNLKLKKSLIKIDDCLSFIYLILRYLIKSGYINGVIFF